MATAAAAAAVVAVMLQWTWTRPKVTARTGPLLLPLLPLPIKPTELSYPHPLAPSQPLQPLHHPTPPNQTKTPRNAAAARTKYTRSGRPSSWRRSGPPCGRSGAGGRAFAPSTVPPGPWTGLLDGSRPSSSSASFITRASLVGRSVLGRMFPRGDGGSRLRLVMAVMTVVASVLLVVVTSRRRLLLTIYPQLFDFNLPPFFF
ncbi:hypothetical protein BC828DRAFT_393201 [Blastocladiella britannica]|nr:hypothetical protein BC828DRAFT_393201 [Blastocladiella britannica]